ncbi:hypothetical protein [Ferrimonas marina]|uniref:hypothetical protein n=1 Tax=Ferrimonas marina TaxID=299255 RepID=UPI001161429F|nr:hypothetical protein [Ferrimonas marina]
MKFKRLITIPLVALFVTGCSSRVADMYEQEGTDKSSLSGVRWHNVAQSPGIHGIKVKSIDGQAPGLFITRALVDPGVKTVSIDCYNEGKKHGTSIDGIVRGTGKAQLNFEPGVNYFLQGRKETVRDARTGTLRQECVPFIFRTSEL